MSDPRSADYFSKIKEQLQYWPHTLHQIDDTLDVGLIEGRGKQLLYRAIHSQNLIAFAGSGLSMAYGRMSWREWEKEQKRVVERNTKNFVELAEAALDWNQKLQWIVIRDLDGSHGPDTKQTKEDLKDVHMHLNGKDKLTKVQLDHIWQWLRAQYHAIDYAKQQIERLRETFNLTKEGHGHFPGGEEMPIKFEIAQQLHNQLQRFSGLFADPSNKTLKDQQAGAWPGSLQSKENGAPINSLDILRSVYRDEIFRVITGKTGTHYRDSQKNYDKRHSSFCKYWMRPESNLNFTDLTKALLVDECPHALMLLRKGLMKGRDPHSDISDETDSEKFKKNVHLLEYLEDILSIFTSENQKRNIDGIRTRPERFRILTPFLFENIFNIINKLKEKIIKDKLSIQFIECIESSLSKYRDESSDYGDQRQYLTPSSRFIISVLLAMHDNPFFLLGLTEEIIAPTDNVTSSKYSNKFKKCFENSSFFTIPDSKLFRSRRSIMSDRFDVLSRTERELGINRYITTNYDFEIERYFLDQGYSYTPDGEFSYEAKSGDKSKIPDDEYGTDNLGRVLLDQCFKSRNASELVAFALNKNKLEANVYHLHGRATEDDNHVVTERDYLELYLADDEHRNTVDESINIAFSGASVLFLGLGMEETDLLRPLRQFISNRDRTFGYTSIALLPADKGMEARAKFAASLYLRYGVHTIFYGSGQIEIDGKKRGIDWLARVMSLIKALLNEIEIWTDKNKEDVLRREPRKPEDIINYIRGALGKIGADLADNLTGYPADTYSLNVLLGKRNEYSANMISSLLLCEYFFKPANKLIEINICEFTPLRPNQNAKTPKPRASCD